MLTAPAIVTSPVGSGTPAPTVGNELNTFNSQTASSINALTPQNFGGSSPPTYPTHGQIQGVVDPRDYAGWDPTGTNDVSQLLQQAVYDAISNKFSLQLTVGAFALNVQPLNLAPWYYSGLTMQGMGGQPVPTISYGQVVTPGNPASVFISSMQTLPALCATAWRWMHLADFGIAGPNISPNNVAVPHDVQADYVSPGCRDSQYSPQCNLALDAFNCAVPTDSGYPTLSGYTCTATLTAGSSQIQLTGTAAQQFLIGNTILFPTTIGNITAGTYWITGSSAYNFAGTRWIQIQTYSAFAFPNHYVTPNTAGTATVTGSWYATSTQDGGSLALIERVSCILGVVGIGHCLSGVGSQSDFVEYKNLNVQLNATNFAIGQSQSKGVYCISGIVGGNTRCSFDGLTYGSKNGYPIKCIDVGLGGYRIAQYSNQVGPGTFIDCYAEKQRTLFTWGNAASTAKQPLLVMGGSYNMAAVSNFGSLPPIPIETWGTAEIRNVELINNVSPAVCVWSFAGNDFPIKISGGTLAGSNTSGVLPYFGITGVTVSAAQSSTPGVLFDSVYCPGASGYHALISDFDAPLADMTISNRLLTTHQTHTAHDAGNQYVHQTGSANGGLCPISITAGSLTLSTTAITFTAAPAAGAINATLTSNWTGITSWYNVTFNSGEVRQCFFTNGSTAVQWAGTVGSTLGLTSAETTSAIVNNTGATFTTTTPYLLQVNDLILWKFLAQGYGAQQLGCGLQVSGISGNNITCTLYYDASQYDTVANQPSTTTLYIVQTAWAPSGATLTGTTDGSTAVLTGVSPTGILKNGDWVNGAGLAANSRVVSGAGTASVTLNQNTTAAGTTQLYFGQLLTAQQLAAINLGQLTTNYTFVLNDANDGKTFNGSNLTATIPANSSVPFPLGTVITIANLNASNMSIAITSDTLTLAASTTTGTRTLSQNGICTLFKCGPTNWIAGGSGVS